MHAVRTTVVALLLTACPGQPAPQREPPDPPPEVAPLDAFRALATNAGWTVGDGGFSFASMAFCCEPNVNCLGTDPAATTGSYSLPPAPEQTQPDPDLYWMWGPEPPPSTTRDFRLRADEALVWIGTLPPPSDYLGFRTMLSTRRDANGNYVWVLGALGPTMNQDLIADQRGSTLDDIWGTEMVLVSAADHGVGAQVQSWLVEAGYPTQFVHADPIAANTARMGFDPEADTFTALVTVLEPDDPSALEAWRQQPATVLRLTPGTPQATNPVGSIPLPARGAGTDEHHLQAALDDLQDALIAAYSDHFRIPRTVYWDWHQTYACLDQLECMGDWHDRLRARTDGFQIDGAGFALVYGVNHVRTGKATTETLAIHSEPNGLGVAWVSDEELVGTARAWLGDSYPGVDDLYAMVVSRDCNAFYAPCVELPSTCPGAVEGDAIYVSWSSYREPATGAAPLETELVLDRVAKLQPVGAP